MRKLSSIVKDLEKVLANLAKEKEKLYELQGEIDELVYMADESTDDLESAILTLSQHV